MDIETDCAEVKVQIGVGFRTCKVCGKTFAKDMQHPNRTKCPECCVNHDANHRPEIARTAASFREMKRCEQTEAQKIRERMRKRDEAYARWERENGRKVVVEDHGKSIVEIRGQRCGGCFAANR